MAGNVWDPHAPRVGEQAPDLDLLDEAGKPVQLADFARRGPLLVLVFRDPDDGESLKLLRQFRDYTLLLRRGGVQLCGIAQADPGALAYMRVERGLGFPLLADADGTALSRWAMLDECALVLLDRHLNVRQRALGTRAPPDALLTFVRRGGTDTGSLRERLSHLLHAIAHAFRPQHARRVG